MVTTPRVLLCAGLLSGLIGVSATPISTTRFQVDSSGRIVLSVDVDGTPHGFAMDTASPYTTISAPIAARLNRMVRDERPGVRVVEDVSLELLGVPLPHQMLRVTDEPGSEAGVIGADVWLRFLVKIDFRARQITLWEPSAAIKTRHAVVVPADFSSGLPLVRATIAPRSHSPSPATLVVGTAALPGTVALSYRYAATSGLLDESTNGQLPVALGGITKGALSVVARMPGEPERTPLLLADGIVSARALTDSWIMFDPARRRIVLGR